MKTKTDPLIKLQNLLLDGGDISMPEEEGETWLLYDANDFVYGEGETLKAACEQLPEEIYGEL